uniref:CASP-like protein n=1 Tax=Tanacetum cinerariifolium TaxID=118510 RepID=A0A6L2J332_TANCI|nr:CASP-like protein 4A3 [Tanacetum cinerariifolium]
MSDTDDEFHSPLPSPIPLDDSKAIVPVENNNRKPPPPPPPSMHMTVTAAYNRTAKDEVVTGVAKLSPGGGGGEHGGGGRPGGRVRKDVMVERLGLGFRVMEMVLCLIAFSVMASDKTQGWSGDSFDRYREYRYVVAVNAIGFSYAAFQAIDMTYHLIHGKHIISYYLRPHFDFIIDQILAYLLISASSSAATRVDDWVSNWGKDDFTQMATASIGMSFLAFGIQNSRDGPAEFLTIHVYFTHARFPLVPRNLRKGSAKVSWEVVCLPKDEGGLGVRRLDHFNKALMVSHIWKLISLKESLWMRWIHVYKLKGRSFWDIPHRGNMTWGWRKILQLRPLIREFIWYNIGDGSRVSIWFDKWCSHSPLSTIISPRDIFRAGFDLASTVRDVIHDGIDDKSDCLEWLDGAGVGKPFSVHLVWSTIRPRDINVAWFDLVWFPNCIPRHAFNMWLIIKKRLKTHDSLNSWDVSAGLSNVCPLCETQSDLHEHLLFDCLFSQ